MSLPSFKSDYISEQEYLEDEKIRDIKHEYFNGEIFAMSGASTNHQRIISNLVMNMGFHLKGTPCEVFSSDMKVRADKGKKYFYPDVLVSCHNADGHSHFTEAPRLIVEVLSASTHKYDRTLKRDIYQSIPSLEEYVLIEQDVVRIEVARKANGWQSDFYYLEDDVTFTSIHLTLTVFEIYQRVDNEELRFFLKNS
jgi:Uma2 family endonuclease